MMTAEKWYEYQDNYRRHGIELKPKAVTKPTAETQSATITIQDKIKIIFLIFLVGTLCIGVVITSAYVASVRHEINTINRYSTTLRGEIENLNVRIETATNIRVIEEKALNDLGMIYPSHDQFVFLQNRERSHGDFAMRLKRHALN